MERLKKAINEAERDMQGFESLAAELGQLGVTLSPISEPGYEKVARFYSPNKELVQKIIPIVKKHGAEVSRNNPGRRPYSAVKPDGTCKGVIRFN